MAVGPEIQPDEIHLTSTMASPEESFQIQPVAPVYAEVSLEEVERDHILATLQRTEWNKSRAAQILGIERSTLDRKLKKYGVKRPGL